MDYLQFSFANARKGELQNLNHLGWIVNTEQVQLSKKIANDGFWFVDIPRTSSTSIKVNLGQQFGYPHGKENIPGRSRIRGASSFLLPSHTPAFIAKDIVGEDVWNRCKTFSVVRNPYAWMVSLWKYTKTYAALGFADGNFTDFAEQFRSRIQGARSKRGFYPANYLQHDYLVDKNSNALIVKAVVHFEAREELDQLLVDVGLKQQTTTEKLAETDAQDYILSAEERRIIRDICAPDFEILGYN